MTITNTSAVADSTEVPDLVALSGQGVARLVELLDLCHAFLDNNPIELGEYCTGQPPAVTPSRVIDQLSWHALLLRLQLAEQADENRHG